MGLILNYVQETKSGFRYRRRVPDNLRGILGKREITQSLGRTRQEALKAYPSVHSAAAKALESAARQLAGISPIAVAATPTEYDLYRRRVATLRKLGFDPFNAAVDPHNPDSIAEGEARSAFADELLEKYPIDAATGHPEGVSSDDLFMVRALNNGAPAAPALTLEDAKKLYLKEKIRGSDFEKKKNSQRVERVYAHVIEALGTTPAITGITRDDAKRVRDHMLALGSLQPASVKRELNIVKAMINHAATEFGLGLVNNPFNKLEIVQADQAT